MTATPDRTDNKDIYSLFDHNIAYEIRLNKAMEENMLIPFHYYGVTDLSVNDEILENESDFRLLTANERVNKIILVDPAVLPYKFGFKAKMYALPFVGEFLNSLPTQALFENLIKTLLCIF